MVLIAAAPGVRLRACSQRRPDFVLQHSLGSFAQRVPLRAGRTRDDFRPFQRPGSCRCNRSAPHALTPQIKIIGWRSHCHDHYITHCSKREKSMIRALVRHGPRCGSARAPRAAPTSPGGKGQRLVSAASGRAGAFTGSCSARRRKRPSVMSGASVLPWGSARAAGNGLGGRERASTAPLCDGGFGAGSKRCPGFLSL